MVYAPTYHAGDFVTRARCPLPPGDVDCRAARAADLAELAKGDEDNLINYLDMLKYLLQLGDRRGYDPPLVRQQPTLAPRCS